MIVYREKRYYIFSFFSFFGRAFSIELKVNDGKQSENDAERSETMKVYRQINKCPFFDFGRVFSTETE